MMRIKFKPGKDSRVTKWFAWRPVMTGYSIVWLENVERQWIPDMFKFRGGSYTYYEVRE